MRGIGGDLHAVVPRRRCGLTENLKEAVRRRRRKGDEAAVGRHAESRKIVFGREPVDDGRAATAGDGSGEDRMPARAFLGDRDQALPGNHSA